jgi:hypothetical protein
MSGSSPQRCRACDSPLTHDQRYCLECGSRIGSRSPQLIALLHRLDDRPLAGAVRPAEPGRPGAPGPPAGLALPSPMVSALIVLAFLGFGVLLGGVAGSSVNATLAASAAPRVKLVLPPPAAPAASASPASSSSSSSSEPSPPEETPTPTEAPAASRPAKTSTGAAGTPAGSAPAEGQPAGSGTGASGTHSGSASKLPPVRHVFVIMLSDQPYASVFGPSSTARYLAQTLESRGELLVRYDAVAHEQLANGIALLSGQGPTAETAANCPAYADLVPAAMSAQQLLTGHGCVYPAATQTLPGQLAAAHRTWRAYVQGLEGGGPQAAAACAHPALGAPDPTVAASPPAGAYATFRNPFVYFHSVIDSPACRANDVGLARLARDLASGTAPSFSYIVPDRCHDGSATPCAAGAPAGMTAADSFLKSVVPQIVGSKAYKQGGLLVITVDEAPSSGEFADSSSCCGQPRFPNLPASAPGLSARGGGAVGALLLSPFVKGATTSREPYNHFSLLRTIEDLFGLRHLGYAGASGVTPFEPALFSAYAPH